MPLTFLELSNTLYWMAELIKLSATSKTFNINLKDAMAESIQYEKNKPKQLKIIYFYW